MARPFVIVTRKRYLSAHRCHALGVTPSVPLVEPIDSDRLEVGDGHRLYWEAVGNPTGIPAVFLHGGPGSGSSPAARGYFEPSRFRAFLFDQRGCGRSRPLITERGVDLSTFTTDRLVADIERLRGHVGVDRWLVVGVSWGVTLALAYAQAHPQRVAGMALGAVTAGTRREISWITRDIGRVFPEQWHAFVSLLPPAERSGNIAAGYLGLLTDPDEAVREQAALAWCAWEDTHVSLRPGWSPDPRYHDPGFRRVFATMVTHFWSHDCFLPDGQLFANMRTLAGIPAVLVHGRHDISSPLDSAWRIHCAWPGSELVIVDDAGHGGGSFLDILTAVITRLGTEQP
jgi:proline iminopeptidase